MADEQLAGALFFHALFATAIWTFGIPVCQISFETRRFNNKDLLHFVPVLLIGLYIATARSRPAIPAIDQFIFSAHIRLFLSLISIIIYHGLAYRCWEAHRSSLQQYFLTPGNCN
ncbi:MAG TPA: hypothetical protein VF476_12130 [Chitinophagaceae bacterium]